MNNIETYIKIAEEQLQLAKEYEVESQIIDHQAIVLENLIKAVQVLMRHTGCTTEPEAQAGEEMK